jgi:hypothetical protein
MGGLNRWEIAVISQNEVEKKNWPDKILNGQEGHLDLPIRGLPT